MDIQSFISHFAEQFDETDIATFKAETNFKNLDEWSSLMALSIIAMVDEEYGLIINGDDILYSNTINDLFEKVKGKRN